MFEDTPATPSGDPEPNTGLRIGRWVPDAADTTPRPGVRRRADRVPAVPATVTTPAPEYAAPEPSRRRVHPRRRRRLVAAGLAGVVSAGSVAALLRPAAEPAAVHADSAPVGVTNPGRFSPGPQIPVSVEPSTAPASRPPSWRPPSWRPPASPAPTTAPAMVTILPADHERGLRSLESERETEIKFVNHRDEPIVINWLDYRGARERYGILATGGVREQRTYVNHPWVITDLRGRSLAVLLPTTRPAQVTIT